VYQTNLHEKLTNQYLYKVVELMKHLGLQTQTTREEKANIASLANMVNDKYAHAMQTASAKHRILQGTGYFRLNIYSSGKSGEK